MSMEKIGQLNIIQEIKSYNDNLALWLAETNEGDSCEVLTIKKNPDYELLLSRLIRNEILPLINQDMPGIQKIVQVDVDNANQLHYIVYQHYENLSPFDKPTLKALKNLLVGLDQLKKQNRFGFLFSNETIISNENTALLRFVGFFELFKQQNLLNTQSIAPEIKGNVRPNFQSDIFSVFSCFSNLLKENTDETLRKIFEKALQENRISRFSKYSEIIDELEKVIEPPTIIRPNGRLSIKVVVKQDDRDKFLSTLTEMNTGCYFLLDKDLSEGKGQITGQFSTKNFSGRFFADSENHIFIPVQHVKNNPLQRVIQQGFIAEYGFDFSPSKYFDSFRYLNEKWEQINTISELNKTKHDLVKKWQTLPDQEREFIEETAFKAKFLRREESKNNPTNIRFSLTNEFRNWELLKELKRTEVNLFIDDKILGKIHDYNPSACFLIIKDARITLDEIPEQGELSQDVRMETSQFKKQVEACKKFGGKDIVNPELCGILATPERVPVPKRIDIDHEKFRQEVINPNLRTDDTQREAVLEALHYKPVYLIQGPPGTGKTTVIVELIQQIIKQNSNAKILITSQSNLAVDNVLERLPESILFMRLASDEDRISRDIKEHSFQNKLKNWVRETQEKSDTFFNEYFQSTIRDKALVRFHNIFANLSPASENLFADFKNHLRVQSQHIKEIFGGTGNIKEVEKIFNEKLGREYQQLKMIQKDWFAFLSNADTGYGENKKSMLNDGSRELDLRTAFVKSVNVIGATCIHIASGLYNTINFRFDYVIMDESSKASPAESLVPINMGQNIILIGDHKQLPPVITREEAVKQKVKEKLEDNGLDIEKEFGESLFEKLITDFEVNTNLQNHLKMLDIQYRMPRHIGNLISRFFYDNKLKNPDLHNLPNFDKDKFHGLNFKRKSLFIMDTASSKEIEVPNSVIFISTSTEPSPNDNDDKFNRSNACNKNIIKSILDKLNTLYANNLQKEKPFTIGIIAGYRGQVSLLKDSIDLMKYGNFVLKNEEGRSEPLIEINTVDKFQGAERDIIIYDIVKSSKGSSSIGFLDDYRRVNVALSRAKRLLIIVGDSEYILKRATLNTNGKFKEFKLREITAELSKQGVVIKNFNEILE